MLQLSFNTVINIYLYAFIQAARFVKSAGDGDMEHVKTWLAAGRDVDVVDYTDCTALHVAAARGQTEIVKLLCHVGADTNFRDKNMLVGFI